MRPPLSGLRTAMSNFHWARTSYDPHPTPKADDWMDEGSCLKQDPQLFEIDTDLPHGEILERAEEARSVCLTCPVIEHCSRSASDLDRYWTVRGGETPGYLLPQVVQPSYSSPLKTQSGVRKFRPLKTRCKRGHNDWRFAKRGTRFCGTCKDMHERARRGAKMAS